MPVSDEVVVIGVDDFTQKLLGTPDNIQLPKIGANIKQGEQGWKLQFNEKVIDVLSPINGEVVEVNSALLENPELANGDPYQKGWLLKVKPSKLTTDLKNLLSGALARAWIEDNVNKLSARMTGNLGIVLQDGGLPISGFAREISHEHWDDLAREFLLTKNLN
jgi:glycine cleavage system H lipoate-binding protein